MKTVEYRVRPVTRYIVTEYVSSTLPNGPSSVGSEAIGEFFNESGARSIAKKLAIAAQNDLSCTEIVDADGVVWASRDGKWVVDSTPESRSAMHLSDCAIHNGPQ